MISHLVVLILAVAIGAPNLLAQSPSLAVTKTKISSLPIGTKLDLRLKAGEKIKAGRLVSVDEDGFAIAMSNAAPQSSRKINFDDVEAFTAHKPTHTPVAAWVATGVIIGVVVAVVVGFVMFKHNE
jgi:hypothetical protein